MNSELEVPKVTTLPSFNPNGSEVMAKIKRLTKMLIYYIEQKIPNNRQHNIAPTNYKQATMWTMKANFI